MDLLANGFRLIHWGLTGSVQRGRLSSALLHTLHPAPPSCLDTLSYLRSTARAEPQRDKRWAPAYEGDDLL